MHSSLSLIVAASTCLRFAAASPIYADSSIPSIESRATFNCTDLQADPSTVCWDELKLPQYIANWNKTTPYCAKTGGDGSNCCQTLEPWTTCFLRLAYGAAGSDCSTPDLQKCTLRALDTRLDSSIAAQAAYVVRTIVVINELFTSFISALSDQSSVIAGANGEPSVLQQILGGSSEVGATLVHDNVVRAFVVGLPFWGTSPVLAGGPQQITRPLNTPAAKAFAQSLKINQAFDSELFGPVFNKSDVMTTESDLVSNLGEAQDQLKSVLGVIMSYPTVFIAWATHGLYSGETGSVNITPGANGVTTAFTTYLVGAALAQAQFSATPSFTTVATKAAFQQGRTCTTLGDVCKDTSGKTYYWSAAYRTEYVINPPSGAWAAKAKGSSETAIQQLGFEASAYGLLGQIETLDVACLSTLPIYLPKGLDCPAEAVKVGGNCPFGYLG